MQCTCSALSWLCNAPIVLPLHLWGTLTSSRHVAALVLFLAAHMVYKSCHDVHHSNSFVPEAQTRLVQVQLQLVTATVKLFLKKPTERPQQMIQLVLTYATQETDNPDLRDRAYVYWSVPCLYLQNLSVACTFLKTCVNIIVDGMTGFH